MREARVHGEYFGTLTRYNGGSPFDTIVKLYKTHDGPYLMKSPSINGGYEVITEEQFNKMTAKFVKENTLTASTL